MIFAGDSVATQTVDKLPFSKAEQVSAQRYFAIPPKIYGQSMSFYYEYVWRKIVFQAGLVPGGKGVSPTLWSTACYILNGKEWVLIRYGEVSNMVDQPWYCYVYSAPASTSAFRYAY